MTQVTPVSARTNRSHDLDPADVARALVERLRSHVGELGEETGRVSVRRPLALASGAAPLALWDLPGDALFWSPPSEDLGAYTVGWGTSAIVRASGASRFAAIREAGRELLDALALLGETPAPRLFGGFSFASDATPGAPWTQHGDATFVLPRWSVERDGAGLFLRLTAAGSDLVRASREVDELAAWLRPVAPPAEAGLAEAEHEPRDRWGELLAGILDGIGAGRFDKVVAARRSELRFRGEVSPRAVLTRLERRYPGCTRFGLRLDGVTFFGATPERLVTKRGGDLRTEALAGSAAPGESARLLESAKDLDEHRMVVDEVARVLATLGAEVEVANAPVVEALPNVLHLQTPIRASLADASAHVLDVADALHPTPAVGGLPRAAAVAQIVASEPHRRGWYSAPFGYFDAAGDGAFVVALRSGVIAGDRAFAYAGGGIVAGSEPEAEYRESELKLQPVLSALTE